MEKESKKIKVEKIDLSKISKEEFDKMPCVNITDIQKDGDSVKMDDLNDEERQEMLIHINEILTKKIKQNLRKHNNQNISIIDSGNSDSINLPENMVITINPEIIIREIAGSTILVPTGKMAQDNNCMMSLNETSAFILKSLESPLTIRQLMEKTKEEFDVSDNVLKKQIDVFLNNCLKKKILLEI